MPVEPVHRPAWSHEGAAVLVLLSALTLFVILRAPVIFETYPYCAEVAVCPEVWIYVGEHAPRLTFNWDTWMIATDATRDAFELMRLDVAGWEGKLVDPMLASGFLTALVAIWLSMPMDRLFAEMAEQLVRDRVLDWRAEDFADVERLRMRLAHLTAVTLALMVGASFVIVFKGRVEGYLLEVTIGSGLLSGIAGHRLGSAAGYGMFARRLRRGAGTLYLYAGHADRIGGTRRLGEFLAYQCILCSVPIIWLSIWLYLEIKRTDLYWDYGPWLMLHMALMAIALVLFWFAFLRPFFVVTRKYRAARAAIRAHYRERLQRPLERARQDYETAKDWNVEQDVYGRLSRITGIFEYVDSLPPLPMRTAVGGAFSLSALFPLITLATGILVEKGTGLAEAMASFTGIIKALGLS